MTRWLTHRSRLAIGQPREISNRNLTLLTTLTVDYNWKDFETRILLVRGGGGLSAIKVYSRLPYPLTSGHIPPRTFFLFYLATNNSPGGIRFLPGQRDIRVVSDGCQGRIASYSPSPVTQGRAHPHHLHLPGDPTTARGRTTSQHISPVQAPSFWVVFFDASSSNKHGQTT